MSEYFEFKNLTGRTLTEVKVADSKELVEFKDSLGNKYQMYHDQDCCESVWLEDQCGSWDDIIGYPILSAYDIEAEQCRGLTWTFYTIATFRGSMTLRWVGESNGYYSESVEFYIEDNK
jgi:hypothetical protein